MKRGWGHPHSVPQLHTLVMWKQNLKQAFMKPNDHNSRCGTDHHSTALYVISVIQIHFTELGCGGNADMTNLVTPYKYFFHEII